MIDVITEEFNIPVMAAGSTTFAREELDRGLEPDQCYYFANFERVSDGECPDLAIEIDVTSRSLNRLGIYAALRVAEVWRFDGETLEVLRLQAEADDYARSDRSAVLPFLPMNEIASRLLAYEMGNDTARARSFRTWVRDVLAPQVRGGPIEG